MAYGIVDKVVANRDAMEKELSLKE
jgi:hypothetical protein